MANTTPSKTISQSPTDVHSASAMKILDAVQKGFTNVSDIVDFCGPELIDERRTGTEAEMDVPATLRMIDQLADAGYIKRRDHRFARQLKLELTDAGQDAAPELSPVERELLDDYGVSLDALQILEHVIEFEQTDKSPYMERLINEYDLDFLAHQITVLYNQLANTELAEEKGIFRFWIKPTETGRRLVEEYEDVL